MKTLDTYKELENSLTREHLLYAQKFNKTSGEIKRACWRIFNNTATALNKAKHLEREGDYIKAAEIILKSFDRVEKIKADFWL